MPLYGMEEMELKRLLLMVWSENQGQDDLTAEWQDVRIRRKRGLIL